MKPPAEFKVMRVRECLAPADLVDTPERAYQYWRANILTAPWFDPAKEAFVVLILNTRRRIIGHNLVALGSLDSVPVHPREVFRPAIVAAGSAIILVHNHPSGDPTPSPDDVAVTRAMVQAGKLLDIDVLDHLVIGQGKWVSLKERGLGFG